LPQSNIEPALAKLTIDREVDPPVEIDAPLRKLDQLASGIRDRIPKGAPSRARLELLFSCSYLPGDWNDGKPYSQNLNDPPGTTIRNKPLASFMRTWKGR
jgi:hypothetical protein